MFGELLAHLVLQLVPGLVEPFGRVADVLLVHLLHHLIAQRLVDLQDKVSWAKHCRGAAGLVVLLHSSRTIVDSRRQAVSSPHLQFRFETEAAGRISAELRGTHTTHVILVDGRQDDDDELDDSDDDQQDRELQERCASQGVIQVGRGG